MSTSYPGSPLGAPPLAFSRCWNLICLSFILVPRWLIYFTIFIRYHTLKFYLLFLSSNCQEMLSHNRHCAEIIVVTSVLWELRNINQPFWSSHNTSSVNTLNLYRYLCLLKVPWYTFDIAPQRERVLQSTESIQQPVKKFNVVLKVLFIFIFIWCFS